MGGLMNGWHKSHTMDCLEYYKIKKGVIVFLTLPLVCKLLDYKPLLPFFLNYWQLGDVMNNGES